MVIVTLPVFVFDGDCAFCTTCALLGQRHLPPVATWTPWQFANLDELRLTRDELQASVQWVGIDGSVAAGPVAIARLLQASGGVWSMLGSVLAFRPVLWLAWPVYRWVARNRHRMPGGTPACALPQK
jgi:predicted DCC family thiol-disulfide oxidoreductase YuxK